MPKNYAEDARVEVEVDGKWKPATILWSVDYENHTDPVGYWVDLDDGQRGTFDLDHIRSPEEA